jgi:enediyne biosynthesis protein E4
MDKKLFQTYSLNILWDISFLLLLIAVFSSLQSPSIYAQTIKNQTVQNLPEFVDVSKAARVDLNLTSFTAIWGDYDGDGLVDLFVCNARNQRNVLYHNLGNGMFEDVTESVGLVSYQWTSQARWIDIDNDSDLDLYLKSATILQLFENINGKKFKDISSQFNFPPRSCAFWADFNNDGWLDYYICNADADREQTGSPANLLFKNLQNGSFVEISEKAKVAEETDSYAAYWVDYNNDGLVDLYVCNSYQQVNSFFRNNGNETFTDVFEQSGIKNQDGTYYWADYNNDGWIDLFITQQEHSKLYQNSGDGSFDEKTHICGLNFLPGFDVSSNWVDVNNDGYLDLPIIRNPSQIAFETNFNINLNNRDGTFSNILASTFIDTLKQCYNHFWGDYDNDGDNDVYFTYREENELFRNNGNNNNWIKIKLIGTQSNRYGIGANVKVASRTLIQYRQAGLGFPTMSQSELDLSFGLGELSFIDSIRIQWPSGLVQDSVKVKANQKLIFTEPKLPMFTNVSKSVGLTNQINKSFGVACVDFDNNNLVDIFFSNHESDNEFYKNIGFASFKLITNDTGLDYQHWSAIGFGDFDNDGFGDVFAAHGILGYNLFFRNLGNHKFLNITKQTGITDVPYYSTDLALGDFDNNGFLDIYVSNEGSNELIFNYGKLIFKDVSTHAGVNDSLISICTAADYDNDGDLDIYVANNRGGYDDYPVKYGWMNRLYQNNGEGTFSDVAFKAGVQDLGNSKGCCFGDYDNDGDLDLYVGNDGGSNSLFQNNGDGTFNNVTEKAGVAEPEGAHGVLFADFDNDGFLDIFTAGGSYIPEKHDYCVNKDHHDKFYRNNGDGTFSDFTKQAGVNFNKAMTTGIATADFDNDGDLDVVLSNCFKKGMKFESNVLLRNNGNNNHWIHFKLKGRKSNYSAIGARVTVKAIDLIQIREVNGGHGAGSQNSLPVEFGLGDKDFVDRVIIRWPSGIIQELKNLTTDQKYFIEEPVQLGPFQLSSITYFRLKVGFFSLVGLGLFFWLLIFVFIPALKKVIVTRKKKKDAVAKQIILTMKKKPVFYGDEEISHLEPDAAVWTDAPSLLIKINTIKFRGDYLLTHLVEPLRCSPALEKRFHDPIETKTPYAIKEVKIQRLLQKIDLMWQYYANYIGTKIEADTKPVILLKEVGELICNYFGLAGLLNKIFSQNKTDNLHLNFILDNLLFPWHWAYDSSLDKFLCEALPYSVSFAEEKIDLTLRHKKIPHQSQTDSHAIIFYGDWKNHFKELQQVEQEIQQLKNLLQEHQIQVHSVYQDSDEFANIINQLNSSGENIRLIHYSGHIEGNMLELGEKEFLAVNSLKQTYGLELSSQPIVFLNGCRSGEIKNLWHKHDNLATEFLDLGAAACIVTNFQIPETSAKNVALRFYFYFIKAELTAGQSLRKARLDMSNPEFCSGLNPDFDITRYFYNLYGEGRTLFF